MRTIFAGCMQCAFEHEGLCGALPGALRDPRGRPRSAVPCHLFRWATPGCENCRFQYDGDNGELVCHHGLHAFEFNVMTEEEEEPRNVTAMGACSFWEGADEEWRAK